MEKYLKAASGMYSRFKQREAHPMEKYIGRSARCGPGEVLEAVGYNATPAGAHYLIVDCSGNGGRTDLAPNDAISKECKSYRYASIRDLTA